MIRWIRLISKFMTSQSGKQTIATHILPNVSRRKGNQTMKFGQLIEFNRKFFLKKSCIKCGRGTIPRPFSKKSKIKHISGSAVKRFIQFVFIVC